MNKHKAAGAVAILAGLTLILAGCAAPNTDTPSQGDGKTSSKTITLTTAAKLTGPITIDTTPETLPKGWEIMNVEGSSPVGGEEIIQNQAINLSSNNCFATVSETIAGSSSKTGLGDDFLTKSELLNFVGGEQSPVMFTSNINLDGGNNLELLFAENITPEIETEIEVEGGEMVMTTFAAQNQYLGLRIIDSPTEADTVLPGIIVTYSCNEESQLDKDELNKVLTSVTITNIAKK